MKKTKRVLALLMAVCMVTGLLAGIPLTASAADPVTVPSTHHNNNQEDGIVLTKSAVPKDDGTVDISISAHTTGEVVSHSTVTPTDIVLVLDVSGSVDDNVTTSTISGYNSVLGGDQSTWFFITFPRYGFDSTSTTYYIDKNGTKIPVTYAGEDDNDYDFYTDGSSYYYPMMESGYNNQELSYPIVQFYEATVTTTTQNKMEVLKAGAKAFIETTLAKNAGITDESKMHRISIIKYADDSFYDGTSSTQIPSLTVGNNKNSSGYNYTQVVHALAPVTGANATSLKNAIDSLDAGGATAIDYGMNLAKNLLADQAPPADGTTRAEAIIAFTDGEPNHSNGFDTSVANNALAIASALQSTDGVSIYTISVAPNADASVLGTDQTNQFMHYLSSNYPNATSMSNPGTGDITKGYYMTPDGDHALEAIFTGIMQDIGAPHVTMGTTAVLTDAISSYFTLADGTNSISLMTAAKTATGWDNPVVDSSLSYELSSDGKTIKVTGFDYDANYISTTPREGTFYGKALVVQMNVKPVNDIIDAGASVHNGTLPTNAGSAFLADSENISRAEVATPTLTLPKITYSYTVDGANSVVYATKYRLPDTTESVLAGLEREGYTFEGWNVPAGVTVNAGSYIVPNAHIEFTGNLVPKTYNVTYAYSGTAPTGVVLPTPPSGHTAKFGQSVTVADPVELDGYQFVGWTPLGTDVTIDKATNQFVMPARDVTLVGHFEPEETTPYAVEHYLQNLDGATYHLHEVEDKVGKTDATAVAVPKNSYEGFHYDEGNANEVLSAKIENDGSTVLKIYYNRNKYNVTYIIDGANKPVSAPAGQTSVMYGETVQVEENLDVPGYVFSGWTNDAPRTDPNWKEIIPGGTFEMPAADVVIAGFFTKATDVPYIVEHYLQNLDESFSDTPVETENFKGETGAFIRATPINFTGFTYDVNNISEKNVVDGTIDPSGDTVLKLYYLRNKWKVSYEYHGVLPATPPALPPTQTEIMYDADVTVADKVALDGYTFHGWRISDGLEEITHFTMPDHDVVLAGHFHPNDNVRYQIEHFYQDENGEYPEAPQEHEARFGTTGDSVTVYAHKNPGFALDETETNANNTNPIVATGTNDHTLTDIIKGDGSTILKFYYARQSYKVTYVIEGMAPVNQDLYETETTVPYGKEVTLAVIPESEYKGYTFSGWRTEDVEIADGDTGFHMPAHNVTLVGSFTANLNEYTVRHLQETLDGTGEDFGGKKYAQVESETFGDKYTGALVEAIPKNYVGFTPRADNVLTGRIAGDGLVINIYYDRNRYNVRYVYFDTANLPEGAPTGAEKGPEQYDMDNVLYGTSLTVGDKLTMDKPGYEFDGWYTLTASVDADGNYTMPNHNVVFYGDFVNLYIVDYDLVGGTGAEGTDYSAKEVTPDTEITVAAAPTKSGYTFAGWKAEGVNYTAGQAIRVHHNMHFVAQWTPISTPPGGGGPSGGGSINYTITYESNGGTEYEKETHKPGKVVDIDKEPHRDGYVFDGWYADKALTEPIDEVKMNRNHIVYAKWVEDNGNAGNGHETPDALDGEHHFAYVVGYPDGTVRPNDNIDRAEVTAIFFRLLKEEVRNSNLTQISGFTDVETEDWFNKAVATMEKLNIIQGRYPGRFMPTAYITRAEFASICARFDDSEYEVVDNFTDVAGHWAEDEIHEAAAHGWIKGYQDGSFKPDQLITRAEAMTMINRVLNRVPETADDLHKDMIVWPDNADVDAWYYLPVQEATNSHVYKMKNHIYESWTGLSSNTDWTIYQ